MDLERQFSHGGVAGEALGDLFRDDDGV